MPDNIIFENMNVISIVIAPGQTEYTTPGTYSWTAPYGITSVCVVCVGAGGQMFGGISASGFVGAGGGGLGWKNNIPVIPGQTYTVVVGNAPGGNSYFIDTSTVAGLGATANVGGSYIGDGGGNGGNGGNKDDSVAWIGGGGGGAGGYSGNGGNGGFGSATVATSGTNGSGGGGGGGGGSVGGPGGVDNGGGGGGVGIYGQGANGVGGVVGTVGAPGTGGSGGIDGSTYGGYNDASGGLYGGGQGGGVYAGVSAGGAVRIIWGPGRSFPSTSTQNL